MQWPLGCGLDNSILGFDINHFFPTHQPCCILTSEFNRSQGRQTPLVVAFYKTHTVFQHVNFLTPQTERFMSKFRYSGGVFRFVALLFLKESFMIHEQGCDGRLFWLRPVFGFMYIYHLSQTLLWLLQAHFGMWSKPISASKIKNWLYWPMFCWNDLKTVHKNKKHLLSHVLQPRVAIICNNFWIWWHIMVMSC